ncbi:MAG TPA: tetratricopeptide repeat protein, partial [Bryobacteraceae bacterium]|nr:tetratricopeptide repeat protein [Bryobacteraceae bacterium]
MREANYEHELSDQHFTMRVRNGRYFQRRHQISSHGQAENVLEREVDYVLGSGNHSRSYLHRAPSGKLILLPLAWYSEGGGAWAMNPGYDRPNHLGFRRAISYDCMFCHNGYPAGMEAARVGDDPLFPVKLPDGIDCQRCHGPGRAHVEAAGAKQSTAQIRAAIMNPKRLTRDRELEVCLQCHLETTSRTLPYSLVRFDREFFSYRPGEPLASYMLHFDHAPGTGNDDKFEIAHAAYRLRKSACFLRSDRLTCTTCHDPHNAPREEKAVAHYRNVCQSCHRAAHNPGQDCTSCHMAKRRTEDVIHAIMTDHLIQRERPRQNLLAPLIERHDTAGTAYRGEVVPYYPQNSADELYLAVAQVNEGSNLTAGVRRLQAAVQRHRPAAAWLYFEIAEALWKTGQQEAAISFYEEALRRKNDLLPAIRNLGAALLDTGHFDRAESVLSSAPNDPASLSTLGDLHRRQGRLDAAARTYKEAVARDSGLAEAHHGLAQTLISQGDLKGAFAAFQEAVRHRPDYADAHFNWGTALGQAGDLAAAEKHLLLAVKSNPRLVGAYNNLGLVSVAQGNIRQAVERFRKALKIDPGDQ